MISTYDWFIARCKAVINHSRPPEPPMRVRLHEAGHAVAGRRFGYVQQGIMLHEDDTGETSQQYATGMDDDMSVRLQTEIIISMTGFAVTLEYPECFASMFVRQVRQCFSVVWADGFPRCRHRFPVM